MKKKGRVKLSLKIVFISIMSFVLIIATLTSINYVMTTDAAKVQAKQNLEAISKTVDIFLDEWFSQKINYTKSLATNQQVINYFLDPEKNADAARKFLKNEFDSADGSYEAIFLGDYTSGRIVIDGMGGTSIGTDLTVFKFLKGTQANDVYVDREVYRSPVTNRLVFVIAAPVKDESGRRLGLVGTPVEWEKFFENQLLSLTIGEKGYLYGIDEHGIVIGHPNKEYLLQDLTENEFIRNALREKNGFERYLWEGKWKYQSFSEIPETGWIIGATVYEEELIRPSIRASLIIIGLGIVLIIIFSVMIVVALNVIVVSKVKLLARNSEIIASGDLDVETNIRTRDELGDLADSFSRMVHEIRQKADVLEMIADGDLTADVVMSSEKDRLGRSLVKMKESLNDALQQVQSATGQVASGAQQISSASQSLSQGASEQASSLEQITSSITEIVSQTKQNTDNAIEANSLSQNSMEMADKGNHQMSDLVLAMDKINASSDEIKKIVKTIDDIAFQINLLALNANVEAARAGKYGKGFAVVAEEVRNLAVRSANAVKETTEMVEESINNIKDGNKLVEVTANQLTDITDSASKVARLVEEISSASREQLEGLNQINDALNQIDQVTQGNTAGAEETASASEELAAMSEQLKQMVARFKLDLDEVENAEGEHVDDKRQHLIQQKKQKHHEEKKVKDKSIAVKANPKEVISLDDDEFGEF